MAITQVNLPAVYGAAQQYKSNRLDNELRRMQIASAKADMQKKNQLQALMSEYQGGYDPTTDITWNTGRQKAYTNAGRPMFTNAETGEHYSEKSMTSQLPSGEWVNFPTVDRTGRIMPEEEALGAAMGAGGRDPITGRPLQTYGSLEEAESAARSRSTGLEGQNRPMMGQGEFVQKATALDLDFGKAYQEHLNNMAQEQREQMEFEAPLVAKAMSAVEDQEGYTRALNMLANAGVDISDFPERYDENTVAMMVAMGTEVEKLKPTSAMQEWRAAVDAGEFDGSLLDWKRTVAQAGRPSNNFTVNTGDLSPGRKKLDESFVQNIYVPFVLEGGFADAEKGMEQIKLAREKLEEGEGLTGTLTQFLPETLRAKVDEEGLSTQQIVEDVVQRNLRLVLGAQFTEKEGERLIARAYDPRLSEEENATRLDRLFQAMEDAYEARLKASEYFEENETMRGYRGARAITDSAVARRLEEALESPEGVSEPDAGEAEAGDMDFSAMSTEELLGVDETKLNIDQLDAYLDALNKAGR